MTINYFLLVCLFSVCGGKVLAEDAIIPGAIVALSNDSSQSLNFRILKGNSWGKELYLDSGERLEILGADAVLAIRTDVSDSQAVEDMPSTSIVPSENGETFGSYYVRKIVKGKRWRLCWNNSDEVWVVDELRGTLCTD